MASVKEKQVLDGHLVRLRSFLDENKLKPNYQPYIAKLELAISKIEERKNS